MRIGLITGEYPPMQGGVGAFTRELGRAMHTAGHAVYVFTRKQVGDSQSDGITLSPTVGDHWTWNANRLIAEWANRNNLEILNIQFQTAAFDMHPSIHLLPLQIRKAPTVITFHDLRVPYLFPKAGAIRERMVRVLARSAAGVIATDRADELRLLNEWHIPQLRWIPIGSNIRTTPPNGFDRKIYRRELGIGEDDVLISYFGFLNESKGGIVVIEALASLLGDGVPAHLLMIGGRAGASDPTNVAYGERVDSAILEAGLSDRVHWTGFVDEPEVTAAFLSSDISALPYLDGVSLRRGTLMAALAHGRAIVTTSPDSDIPELDGSVETVPPSNAEALAQRIKALWENDQERSRLEKAALNVAEHFSWDEIAANTISFFEQVLS